MIRIYFLSSPLPTPSQPLLPLSFRNNPHYLSPFLYYSRLRLFYFSMLLYRCFSFFSGRQNVNNNDKGLVNKMRFLNFFFFFSFSLSLLLILFSVIFCPYIFLFFTGHIEAKILSFHIYMIIIVRLKKS